MNVPPNATETKERVSAMLSTIAHLVTGSPRPVDPDDALRREWDRLRTEATSERERAEIDAVFSRSAA